MKNVLAAGAAFAACLSTVSADFCSFGSSLLSGNYYCQAVNAITYQNFGSSGSYNKVTYMNTKTGQCSSSPQGYAGSLAPLDDEVSMHFRGPIALKRFAFYSPGHHAKRSANDAHHNHMRFHARRDNQKRTEVTATINGVPVSWDMNVAAQTDAPSTDGSVGGSAGASAGTPAHLKAPYVPPAPAAAGNWVRSAFYDADAQSTEGLTFLNNKGGQGSGIFDLTFGNSLSYASSDGQDGAASPQVLADATLPSNTEVIAMSDRPCTGDSCGYTRPETVAYHGFGGRHKLFAFEFTMPSAATGGFNADMPAIWMLNAQIPRTLQYGQADCSCWTSGCGEFDLFEVLTPGETRMKSTLHGNISGGDSDYFNRPLTGTMKAAVLMSESQAHIKVLHDSFNFDKDITPGFIDALAHSTDDQSSGVSLFPLS